MAGVSDGAVETEVPAAFSDEWLSVYGGHALDVLRGLPSGSVDCVVTSPPYYGLRDYGTATWIGGDEACDHLPPYVRPRSGRPNPGGTNIGKGSRYNDEQDRGAKVYRHACKRCGAIRAEPTVWGGDPDHDHTWNAELVRAQSGGTGRSTLGAASGGHGISEAGQDRSQDRQARPPASSSSCECGAWRGALGLEPTPWMYVEHLVEVMREVRRVLKPHGTLWLNLGDSYANDPKWGSLKPKDLIGIPWRVAFALQEDGWWLRKDVIWSKPNGMPESVDDRPTSAHEYVFMLTRSERYYFDMEAVREPFQSSPSDLRKMARQEDRIGGKTLTDTDELHAGNNGARIGRKRGVGKADAAKQALAALERPDGLGRGDTMTGFNDRWDGDGAIHTGRSLRDVWTIPTVPYPGAHFAVFPPELPSKAILASTSERGVCPECGAPWRRQLMQRTIADAGRAGTAKMNGAAELVGARAADSHRLLGQAYQDQLVAEPRRTAGWTPGCGCGWGGNPDDLELIASPLRRRVLEEDPTLLTGRRGMGRTDTEGEGRWIVTRAEQKALAAQLRAWSEARRLEALADIAAQPDWEVEVDWGNDPDRVPGDTAYAHYVRTDRAGARVPPRELVELWAGRGWLTIPEPPDTSGAHDPVRAVVMDPFAGSGTVGQVANRLSRRAVLIDLNPAYLKQQLARTAQTPLGL